MRQLIFTLFLIVPLSLAQSSEMLEFPIFEAIQTTVPLQADSSEVIKLELAEGSSDLKVQVSETTQTLPLVYITEGYTARASMLAADFNFDGFTDLALPETEGYGGVNYFYKLYLYNQKGFEAMSLPEVDTACNPSLEAETQTLNTNCKSGPMYYQQAFRFEGGKPYLALTTNTLSMDAVGGIFVVETSYDATGKKLSSSIVDNMDETLPPTVTWDKLRLYTSPDKASKTDTYLAQGDEVEVLALSEDNAWVNIAYKDTNGERQTAWIKPLSVEIY